LKFLIKTLSISNAFLSGWRSKMLARKVVGAENDDVESVSQKSRGRVTASGAFQQILLL